MTAQHTPGPWSYSQESIDPEWWIVTIKGGLIVANVNAHAHQEANARLIAAAPDLLAALKDACASLEVQAATARSYAKVGNREFNTGLAEELERNVSVYRRAIAKAEGR